MNRLYSNIRKRRQELGMTQTELAERIGYKDHTTVNKIEAGLVDISVGKLYQFAKALDISAFALLDWSPDEDEKK